MFKKIQFKRLLLFVISIITLFNITSVSAKEKIRSGDFVSGNYYYAHRGNDGTKMWGHFKWALKQSNGDWVYCIQPMVGINQNSTYNVTENDILQITNLSSSTWSTIERIAYYGYGYNENGYNHTDSRWYAATQMLIWKNIPGSRSYFTDGANGIENSNILKNEMDEILSLTNRHYVLPSFNLPSEMVIGSSITINDNNGVLSRYNIDNVSNGIVTKNESSINITANRVGNLSFDVISNLNRFKRNIKLYYATSSQNVVEAGDLSPIKGNYNIRVYGGDVTLHKKDIDTKSSIAQGEATLSGALYGIYSDDGTKVGEVTTGLDGSIKSNYLPSLGRFYLQEITPSNGYTLNTDKYYFNITKDNLHANIDVYEKVIKNKFVFTKVYASNKTGEMSKEPHVKFGVYDKNNNLIKELITDSDGMISIVLPYGHYTFKQLTSTKNYEKTDDISVNVLHDGETIYKTIANKKISARVRVVKVDSDTGEVIKRSGIKFKIYSYDTNSYVCQRTSYPKSENCIYETDSMGEFITPYELSAGKYRLEEVDQVIDGYTWNNTSHDFYIDEDSILRTDSKYGIVFDTKFSNKRVTGTIIVNKKLEDKKLTNKGYVYNTNLVKAGITYNLYADSDIIFNNELIYKKNDLVRSGATDKYGKIVFDNLYLGKYYLLEDSTLDGYILDTNKYNIELKYIDQYSSIVTYNTTLINYLKKGDLVFTKTNYNGSEYLSNTLIEIYNDKDELVYSGITDNKGNITINKLVEGRYYIIEKSAPYNYILNSNRLYFNIENGKITKSIMRNDRLSRCIITKTDSITGNGIPGALIEVFKINDDGSVISIYKGLTDKNGNIYLDGLSSGRYYYVESSAPQGYILSKDRHYFNINGYNEIIKDKFNNTKIQIKVPNTSIDSDLESIIGYLLLGMICIVIWCSL